MSSPNRVLVLFVHPALEKSRINRYLFQAIDGLEHVTRHDLYEIYPNFHIDVEREQRLLVEHDVIVFQHPLYWYSSPAILKEWQDLVLQYGFAYGHNGTALHGKQFLTAITTGGSKEAYCRDGYNVYSIRELLRPFEQTARLCGMTCLPPFVIYGSHQIRDAQQLDQHVKDYRMVITALRDGTLQWEKVNHLDRVNIDLNQIIHQPEGSNHAQ